MASFVVVSQKENGSVASGGCNARCVPAVGVANREGTDVTYCFLDILFLNDLKSNATLERASY